MGPKPSLPFEDLARLNENGEMTKLVAAPLAIVAAALTVIFVVRALQRMRERKLTQRFYE
jgi:hypothetical protein